MVQEKEETFVKQLVAKHEVRSSVESDGATSKTRSHLMLAKISEDPIGEQQTTIKAGSRYMIQKRAQNASMSKKERLRSLSKSKQRGKALAERE